MKLNMKRVILVLCMAACLFALSACGKKQEAAEAINPTIAENMEQVAASLIKQFSEIPVDQIDLIAQQTAKQGDAVLATALESWKNVQGDMGSLKQIKTAQVTETEDGYSIALNTVFEKRDLVFNLGANSDMTELTFMSFSPVYTIKEKVGQASINTLLGMGTVFVILIFISLIIGCFKYINVFEDKMKHRGDKAKSVVPIPAPVQVSAPEAAPTEENLLSDMELVVVLMAAIAAATETSTEGLVVRSIKRVPASKWKKS